jgi:hypothetical protein
MRKWLRDPVAEIPEIPQTPPADPSQAISGICGISDTGAGGENDLLPEWSGAVPAAAGEARRARSKERAAAAALPQPARTWGSEDWQACYDERAAIAEYDGKLSRAVAEALAFDCCTSEWLYRHAVTSPPGPCPICGDADRPNDGLLPVSLGGGQVWLHRGCSPRWRAARMAEAVAALALLGIRGPEGSST